MQVLAQYIPDLFAPVGIRMAQLCKFDVFYDWGHKDEMTRKFDRLDASKTQKGKKYPLFWLVMDFDETHGKSMNTYANLSLSFVLAVSTDPMFSQQQRRDKSFLPRLLPMYEAFLQAITEQTTMRKPYGPLIEHKAALRPYWGDGVNKNLFNDFVDVIEIRNFNLDIAPLLCPKSTTFRTR